MHCTNLNDVKVWWQVLSEKDVIIRRYTGVDVYQADRFDHMTIFKDNLEEWLAGGSHSTFWHLKQLIINLRQGDTEIPVVATRLNDSLFVDPGGSRIAVLKYLGKKTVDVDVICPQKYIDEVELGDCHTIENYQTLLEPYEKMGVNYSMEMCYDSDCITCKNNNVIHNGPYRYSVTWDRPWFYVANYHDWYEKNKHRKPDDIMDWYTI
jgi:hypothetical protein